MLDQQRNLVPALISPYRDTVLITAMAKDQGKREELKEIFHQLGLSLHTEDVLRTYTARILKSQPNLGKIGIHLEGLYNVQLDNPAGLDFPA